PTLRVLGKIRTLGGIAPPLSFRNEVSPMPCSEGRVPALYFFVRRSFRMAGLYSCKTRRLEALGSSTGESHHNRVKLSLTRLRLMLTHCARLGSLAGLCQMNSRQR